VADAARATAAIARAMGSDLQSLFVLAGIPTTIDAIGSAIVELVHHRPPGASDVALLVEELLRRASPIAQFARRATRPTTLGGRRIEAGQQVVLWFVAANRDPRVFADPDAFDPRRAPNPHVAFGVGPHRCLGAALGRRILRAVVRAALAHRVELAGTPVRRASSYLRGYDRVPIYVANT
ncbi:MAG: cytochrome P450, partial [Proteobacteria bacterium]|nr:cytochrome P450 [Pseudomonadota bacterium]